MRCPSCDDVLRRIEYEGVPICTCPGCNGEFLDGRELKYIERKEEIQFDQAERNRLLYGKIGPKQEKRLICPRCGNHMAKGRYRKTDVIIDYCKSCKGVWLDDGELEKIQVLGEAGKTGNVARADPRPALSEAVVGAREAAKERPGESTAEQGYIPEISAEEMTVSIPPLWERMLMAALFVVLFVIWVSGLLHDVLPFELMLDEAALETANQYLPAAFLLMAALIAFSFRTITIRAGRGLTVKRYVLGIPITREYSMKELKCIGTDFSGSYFSAATGGALKYLFIVLFFGWLWLFLFNAFGSSEISGTSYLYVVLKSGKRILVYRGQNDRKVGNLSDFLQAGLKLDVRRL